MHGMVECHSNNVRLQYQRNQHYNDEESMLDTAVRNLDCSDKTLAHTSVFALSKHHCENKIGDNVDKSSYLV